MNGILIGNRIPKDYFITRGIGESDITIHAGSYHLALKEAGIEQGNIITYSSILPAIATEITKPDSITHGEVIESIMAVAHSNAGEQATAGIIFGWLYDRQTGERYGGLVCEHNGNYTYEEIEQLLNDSLEELYVNGFEEKYLLKDRTINIETFIPEKKYGTALVALCFTNYIYPIISERIAL